MSGTLSSVQDLAQIVNSVNERAKQLDQYENFEQAIGESTKRLEASREEEKKQLARLDDIKKEIEAVAKQRVKDLDGTRKEAADILQQAKLRAQAVVNEASNEANTKLETAQRQIKEVIDKKEAHTKRLAGLEDLLAHRKQQLSSVEASLKRHKDLVNSHI